MIWKTVVGAMMAMLAMIGVAPAFGELVLRWLGRLVAAGRLTRAGETFTATIKNRRKDGELYDAEIYQEHPDLAEVLQTEFSAITVGFVENDRVYQYLPPQPPPVHYSVYECAGEELARFTKEFDFFRTLLFAYQMPSDEMLAAAIRAASRARAGLPGGERAYLVQAGREVASLLKDDYDRLTAILRRIRP